MIDLRKYLVLDEEKIGKSIKNMDKLGKLTFISNELDYWVKQFTYDDKRTSLEKFLLYRTAGAFDFYKKGLDDADIMEGALENLKERLYALPSVATVKVGKEIDINEKERAFLITLKNGESFFLESDTGNSLMGDLGEFFRIILKKRYGQDWPDKTYIEAYQLEDDCKSNYYKPFRNFYFYTLISKISELLEDEESLECYKQLEKRADHTHTCKNMILVPYGYNAVRGFRLATHQSKKKIEDRLDLTFVDFKEMLEDKDFNDEAIQKRIGNTKISVDAVRFLLENKEKLFPTIPIYTKEAEDRSMSGILERTKIINNTLL